MHLDRLISVLEAVAIAGRPVSASEIQMATGIPRPSCYRLLQSLSDQGLLHEIERRGYVAGQRLARLSVLAQPDTDLAAQSASLLRDAAEDLGESVFLSRVRTKGAEIVHVETPTDPARSYVHPGLGLRPLHACSCSKVIAAYADESFRRHVFADTLKAFTPKTCTDPMTLEAELGQIRRQGYAECVEELEVGVASVAVPVVLGDAGSPFSIGATGPIRRFGAGRRHSIGGNLSAVAMSLTKILVARTA